MFAAQEEARSRKTAWFEAERAEHTLERLHLSNTGVPV